MFNLNRPNILGQSGSDQNLRWTRKITYARMFPITTMVDISIFPRKNKKAQSEPLNLPDRSKDAQLRKITATPSQLYPTVVTGLAVVTLNGTPRWAPNKCEVWPGHTNRRIPVRRNVVISKHAVLCRGVQCSGPSRVRTAAVVCMPMYHYVSLCITTYFSASLCITTYCDVLLLLQGGIVNRTYGIHKNLYMLY